MGSFGRKLRREREMRGISLEEIAQHTKISTRMLEAIETDRFDLLPGGIFNRSFVLHYARYLGLNEEQAAAEFDLLADAPKPVSIEAVAAQRAQWTRRIPPAVLEGAEERTKRRLLPTILLAVVLLSLSGYALREWWWPRLAGFDSAPRPGSAAVPPQAAPTTAAPTTAAPTTAAPTTADVAPGSPQPPPGTPEAAKPASPAAQPAPPAPIESGSASKMPGSRRGDPGATTAVSGKKPPARLQLQIDTLDSSWVAAYADGKKIFEATMRKKETRTLDAESRIELRAGNAGVVVLTLNGETQPPLGRMGEAKTVVFTIEDLKRQ